jgi:hypothetical protein
VLASIALLRECKQDTKSTTVLCLKFIKTLCSRNRLTAVLSSFSLFLPRIIQLSTTGSLLFVFKINEDWVYMSGLGCVGVPDLSDSLDFKVLCTGCIVGNMASRMSLSVWTMIF